MADRILRCAIQGNPSVTDMQMEGRYTWDMICHFDNSFNDGSVQRQVQTRSSVTGSYSEVKKSIWENQRGTTFGGNAGVKIYEIVDIGVKGDVRNEAKIGYETLSETKRECTHELTRTDTYTVGPRCKLTLYALRFTGPGITYQTDIISTSQFPDLKVKIYVTLRAYLFLKDIEVHYTDESVNRPEGTMHMAKESKGKDPDINAGFGGKHVWLVPKWTDDVSEAATGISIACQKNENSKFKDLAKGTDGLRRYILIENDPDKKGKLITDVGLYRTSKNLDEDNPQSKWDYATDNINKDRGKDFLYVVWNTGVVCD